LANEAFQRELCRNRIITLIFSFHLFPFCRYAGIRPEMKTLYARYNRHRLPPFQIETAIVEMDGKKYVVKKALTAEASAHIAAMRSGYELVRHNLKPGGLLLPARREFGGDSVGCEYIEGTSLDKKLFQSFRANEREIFYQAITDYCGLIEKSFNFTERFAAGPQFHRVFGIADVSQAEERRGFLPLAAVDAVFENIIFSDSSYYLIDNEWVFEGTLPFLFLLFRSLFYFHKVKYHELGIEQWIPFDELLGKYRITKDLAERYLAMDETFQQYVYGAQRCYKYKEQYQKRQISVHSLEKTIENQRRVVRKYHDEIMDMRALLAERERIIDGIVNSVGWRMWQKIRRVVDCLCPAGSWRGRCFDRLIAFLKAKPKPREQGAGP
jgi:hypothetical protein